MTFLARLWTAGLCCLLGLIYSPASRAYPDQPIKIVVPFAPGGSNDTLARIVAERLASRLKQPVLVDNRPGAGGNIGAEIVAKAAPDGYTLVMGSIGTHATNGLIYPSMPFDTEKDFAPVTLVAAVTLVLVVHPSLPARSTRDLIALLKADPGKYNYASGGIGASQHLAAELFKYQTHTQMMHVPYKGSAGALADLLSGRVPIMFADLPLVLSHIRGGALRALAVGDLERSPELPDVPTIAESGVPGYDANAWYGLFAPAGTPPAIVDRLQKEVAGILAEPGIRQRLKEIGARPGGMTPGDFREFQKKEIARWRKVVETAQIKME